MERRAEDQFCFHWDIRVCIHFDVSNYLVIFIVVWIVGILFVHHRNPQSFWGHKYASIQKKNSNWKQNLAKISETALINWQESVYCCSCKNNNSAIFTDFIWCDVSDCIFSWPVKADWRHCVLISSFPYCCFLRAWCFAWLEKSSSGC